MNRLFNFGIKNNIIYVDYKYNLGHLLGESQLSPNRKFSYVNIPKNASSSSKKLLHDWKFVNFHEKQYQPTFEYIVILRDPTERWISGIAEYLVGKYSSLGQLNAELSNLEIYQTLESKFFQNLLFDFVIFDGHSLPQCWYLQGLKLDKIKFFNFDSSAIDSIANYVGITEYSNYLANDSLTHTKKNIIIRYLTDLLKNNTKFQKIIDIHYYADHKLFDLVKF